MMGGSIHVESTLGAGSKFCFTVRFEKQATQSQGDSRSLPIGLLTGVRALVVESSAINLGILREQMASWEMTTRVAETPKQAIDVLAQAAARSVPYDVAVIDLSQPGMDALELARTIRARADVGKVRLVMLTRRHADARNARDAGFDACVVKPVRQTVLYECLVNVMAGRQHEAVEVSATAAPLSTVQAGIHGHILVVEDNFINQQVAVGILQIQGYSVTVANDGREAVAAYAQGAFDLILMDCHMPEMDGFEATREIRARERASSGKHVPIIALTANAMAHDREECLNAGMDDHLSKPFTMLTLQEMLDRWLPQTASPQWQAAELAAQATAKAAAVLDRQMLEQLGKVRTNGKPELLARVINLYLVESPKLIQKLKQAAGADDAQQIARSAHSLKSCSANVGARALSRYCEDIEASARRADTEEARKILAKLEAEHDCVQSALTAEFEQLAAGKA
jgi:CheY-like chemotaxis protein/HPt (histidine-containing phosphotransfer) domain-containing protein